MLKIPPGQGVLWPMVYFVKPGKLTGWFGRLPDGGKVCARRIVIIISQVNGENRPGFATWFCVFLKKMISKWNMLVVSAIRNTGNRSLYHINISKKRNTIVNTHKQCNKQSCKWGYIFQFLFHWYKLTRNRAEKQNNRLKFWFLNRAINKYRYDGMEEKNLLVKKTYISDVAP